MLAKYEADKAAALVELNMYLSQPMAVADHPNILKHCHDALQTIITADSSILKLKQLTAPKEDITVDGKPPNAQ